MTVREFMDNFGPITHQNFQDVLSAVASLPWRVAEDNETNFILSSQGDAICFCDNKAHAALIVGAVNKLLTP